MNDKKLDICMFCGSVMDKTDDIHWECKKCGSIAEKIVTR